MRSPHLIGLGTALAAAALAAQMPTALELLYAPQEGGQRPKPTPKRGKPTKAEKKAAKRARRAAGTPP